METTWQKVLDASNRLRMASTMIEAGWEFENDRRVVQKYLEEVQEVVTNILIEMDKPSK